MPCDDAGRGRGGILDAMSAAPPSESPDSAPPHARPRLPREIHVLVLAAFVVAIGFGVVAPVLPEYARSFDVGVTAASAVVSAFAFMRLVFAPVGGRLITRFGERRMYVTGLLIVALSTGAAAFAQSYGQLLVMRGLGGIGSVLFTVSAMALLVRLAPPRARGRASSLYGSAFLLGGIGGPALGSVLGSFGYRVPFLFYAVTLVIAAAVVALFLVKSAPTGQAGSIATSPVLTVREALRDSAYRCALVGGFANGWANFGARMSLVPLFIGALPDLALAATGIALTLFAVGNAAALGLAGRLVDSLGRRPVAILGFAVSALATIPFGLVHHAPVLYALSVLGGIGAGLLMPALQVALADVVGGKRSGGPALAAFQMAQDCGAILGPVVTGAVVALAGFGWAFSLTGAILGAAALAWTKGRETRGDALAEG